MHVTKLTASLLVPLALMFSTIPAWPETVNCTPITTLPAVITVQGIHCLTGDLSTAMTSGNAITINANNVVLDLNGRRLGGLGAGTGTLAIGIFSDDRSNITVKNGTVRGFHQGIVLSGTLFSQGHVVEDIRADQNRFIGILTCCDGNIVRNNHVVDTGGSTVNAPNANAYGIAAVGDYARVINNDVFNTFKLGSGEAVAIDMNATGGLAVNNRVTQAETGIRFLSTGKYRDNLTFGVTTPFTGGTGVGTNN